MRANLMIKCDGCGSHMGIVPVDTADMPEVLLKKINQVILAHRPDCP
jgi:hypothetical protein